MKPERSHPARLLVTILVLVFHALIVEPCLASTLTVTTLADSGPGSLRQTIADAASGDTITFAVAGTIRLTHGVINIAKNLNISAPGPSSLTLAGNHEDRIFRVYSGTLAIQGVTFMDGDTGPSSSAADYDYGGGAILNHAWVVVQDCVFTNNRGYVGGAINNFGTTRVP